MGGNVRRREEGAAKEGERRQVGERCRPESGARGSDYGRRGGGGVSLLGLEQKTKSGKWKPTGSRRRKAYQRAMRRCMKAQFDYFGTMHLTQENRDSHNS